MFTRFCAMILALAAFAGCDDEEPTDADTGTETGEDTGDEVVEVNIDELAFTPLELTINVGQTVRWTNGEEEEDHTVTAGTLEASTPDVFDSGILSPGDTFEFTLDEAGTFQYHCEVHEEMAVATITVE